MSIYGNARGVSLIELLMYTGILLLISAVAVSSLIGMSRLYRTIHAAQYIESSAQIGMDRIGREVRGATSIDTLQSTLGSSPGVLTLNTTDSAGTAMTVQFYLSSQTLRMRENGTDVGPLTGVDVRVTRLLFRRITTSHSEAAKIEMTLESGSGASYRSKKFYTTAVLRGSYPIE